MTLSKAFVAVASSAVVCGVIGSVIGFAIGTLAPSAYRGWAHAGAPPEAVDPSFSPAAFGMGLGLGQGLIAGVVIGIALVAIVTWYDVASARRDQEGGDRRIEADASVRYVADRRSAGRTAG